MLFAVSLFPGSRSEAVMTAKNPPEIADIWKTTVFGYFAKRERVVNQLFFRGDDPLMLHRLGDGQAKRLAIDAPQVIRVAVQARGEG